jgi:hypothetical protein
LRQDDLEVYLRTVTFEERVNALVNKFLSRIKWLTLRKRDQTFVGAVEDWNQLKEDNLRRQEADVDGMKAYIQ